MSTPVGSGAGVAAGHPNLPPTFTRPTQRFRARSSLHNSFSFDSHDQLELVAAIDAAAAAKREEDGIEGGNSFASSSHQAILADLAAEQGNAGLSQVSPRMIGPPLGLKDGTKRKRGRLSSISNMSSGLSSASPIPPPRGMARSQPRKQDLLHDLMRSGYSRGVGGDGSPQVSAGEFEETEEGEEEDDPTWEMIGRMRTWRHDAILQHLYETAAFWGDKIFSWTGELHRHISTE